MSTSFHIYMPIDALEERLNGMPNLIFKNEHCQEMFGLSYSDTIHAINDMKSRGMTVIPSDNCDNRSTEGKCLGHNHAE